jgi:hypothetical protein
VGLGVITTDVYLNSGGKGIDGRDIEYYINTVGTVKLRFRLETNKYQANFYRQIRNFKINITAADGPTEGMAGIHYQVSQATSLFNVQFIASQASDTKQQCICKSSTIPNQHQKD